MRSQVAKMTLLWKFIVTVALVGQAVAAPTSLASPLLKRSVICLMVGSRATATWTNAAGKKCTFTGVIGSNYGTNAAGGE